MKGVREWWDRPWNPVTGCQHGCRYCWARSLSRRFGRTRKARRFAYEFHAKRLLLPETWRKPSRLFVVNMGDLFGEWVPQRAIERVFRAAAGTPRHAYLYLTKNPLRMAAIALQRWGLSDIARPDNWWFGASATNKSEFDGRHGALMGYAVNPWISVEPMLGPIRLGLQRPRWVVIGAQTGPGAKPIPQEWYLQLAKDCAYAGVPVFVKDSVPWLPAWGPKPRWTPAAPGEPS